MEELLRRWFPTQMHDLPDVMDDIIGTLDPILERVRYFYDLPADRSVSYADMCMVPMLDFAPEMEKFVHTLWRERMGECWYLCMPDDACVQLWNAYMADYERSYAEWERKHLPPIEEDMVFTMDL